MALPRLEDFHTHYRGGLPSPRAVYSFSLHELGEIPRGVYYTIGLHPWDSDRADAEALIEERLANTLAHPDCLALGEVGLDRLKPDMPRQEELLMRQLKIAGQVGKPAVFHCVRAWSELLRCVQAAGFHGKCAVHGFCTGKRGVLERLLSAGYYLSIPPRITPLIGDIPLELLLAETDDTGEDIGVHYQRLGERLGLGRKEVEEAVVRNMRKFFFNA